MKKLLKISLVSMLVAMPMIAGAAPVAGEPVAGNANSPTATNTPKYALKGAGDGDGNTATAGYVKGAYNAVIKGINNTQDEINTLNTGIETYSDAIGHLTDGKATQSGTVATIKSATTNESIATSSVNFTGVTTTSISATASGNVDLSIPVMADWENDAEATNPVQTTTSFTNLAVNNLTMSAPTSNTARLTKTGINGNVDVVKYLASMAPAFNFTKLINVDGNSYGYKSADGYSSENATGLSYGEWKVTWNKYGTVKGTTMCSSTSGTSGQTGNPSNTEGTDCWCKMTGWTPNGGNETPVASLWIFNQTYGTADTCNVACAPECGQTILLFSEVRSGLFHSVQTSTGFDFSTFTTLIEVDGDDYASKSANYPDGENYNEAGLSNGEWTVTWTDYGTVKGTSMCSGTEAIYGQTGNPSNTEGEYCWCKMTGVTDTDGNATPAASLWVGIDTIGSPADCAYVCANACGQVVVQNSDFKSPLFGSVQ